MTNSIYYLLGHIDNYAGGFSSDDGILKRISYLGFDWKIDHEKIRKSERLIKICQSFLNENNLPNDLATEKWLENKGITIFSKNVIKLVNEFLTQKSEHLGRGIFEMDKDLFDTFQRGKENSNAYKQRLNFLYGVIDSNGIENEFYFYNSYDKCLLTQYVLRCFANEEDQIMLESHFKTPWVDKLTVHKSGDIWQKIIHIYGR